MTWNFFSDKQKQKDAEVAAHFHIKAAKLAQVIKEVCAGGLNFCYFFLIRQTQHFYLLDHWFSDYRLSFPSPCPRPLSQHATFIYIVQNMWTHTQAKAFVGTRGGTICQKSFPNFYTFHCNNHNFCPKLSPVAFQMENLFHYRKILN